MFERTKWVFGCFDAILMRFPVGWRARLNGDIFIKMLPDNKTMFDERDVVNSSGGN